MLIIKNLRKTYRSKGGVTVKALDDVSVTFPETGMVFLLGKSGSGKSTLLNICGGLDTPDSGEIIVRGRSSKTFSESDFDSYRNTFVGFIFQEYNILNEFTVEENLSLALELQGKNKNKKRVNELLEQVDLQGFARRKPNTLSGGQKQRIAIARALIKDPKIIMADEPTGALDSNTGKQVLDTLKKLSQTRLVIIVSHDREFAEIYGDRVIELKDGKIISDVTKEKVRSESMGENISVIAENTISVKRGTRLTAADVEKIQEFILQTDGNVLISNSSRDISSFRQANRIGADDSAERFSETETDKIVVREYTKEEGRLIRSKLPISKATRIGASSLKVKPFRLCLTILLSVAAFLLFGIFSTMMTYSEDNVLVHSYMNSFYNTVVINKNYEITRTTYHNGQQDGEAYKTEQSTLFSPADLEKLSSQFGDDVLGVYSLNGMVSPSNVRTSQNEIKTLSSASVIGFSVANENSSFRKSMIAGTYPKNDDEVAISSWYFTLLKAQALYDVSVQNDMPQISNQVIEVESMEDVIGKYLTFEVSGNVYCYIPVKITGIYDGGEIPQDFDGWDSIDGSGGVNEWENDKLQKYNQYVNETLQRIFLVSDNFYSSFVEKAGWKPNSEKIYDYNKYFSDGQYYQTGWYVSYSSYRVYDAAENDMLPVLWLGEEKQTLSKNEVVLPLEAAVNMVHVFLEQADTESLDARWKETYAEKYKEEKEHYYALYEEYWQQYEDSCYDQTYKQLAEEADKEAEKARQRYEETFDQKDYERYEVLSQQAQEYWQQYYNSRTDGNQTYLMLANEYLNESEFYTRLMSGCSGVTSAISCLTDRNQFKFTDEATDEKKEICREVVKYFFTEFYSDFLTFRLTNDENTLDLTVVGFYEYPDISEGIYYNLGFYISDENKSSFELENYWYSVSTTKYVQPEDAVYSYVYLPYDGTEANFRRILSVVKVVEEDDSFFSLNSSLYRSISYVGGIVESLSQVFLYVGIGLAIFASALLFNFISVSISNKTHEIGVLRAIGARGLDVFKIFFAESVIITCICLALSVFGSILVVSYLNNMLTKAIGFSYSLFVFGGISILMMLGVAMAVAILGTFFPVFMISRKKPVESMKS